MNSPSKMNDDFLRPLSKEDLATRRRGRCGRHRRRRRRRKMSALITNDRQQSSIVDRETTLSPLRPPKAQQQQQQQQQKFLNKFKMLSTLYANPLALMLLIVLLHSSSLIKTSQQQQLAAASNSQVNQNSNNNSPLSPEFSAGERPLAVRALPISARNVLAFLPASHAQPSPPASSAAAVGLNPDQKRPKSHQKCPAPQAQKTSKLSSTSAANELVVEADQANDSQEQDDHHREDDDDLSNGGQVWAVEATNFRLNFVVSGHRLTPVNYPSAPKQQQLHFYWTRDGQTRLPGPGDEAETDQRAASLLLASETERETIRHLLESQTTTLVGAGAAMHNNTGREYGPFEQRDFVLLPFVDHYQVGRLEESTGSSSGMLGNQQPPAAVRQSIQQLVGQAAAARRRSSTASLPDDFIGDGSSIDWRRLAAHLRHRPLARRAWASSDCRLNVATVDNIEQLLVVQLDFQQVQVRDRGSYELHVCQQQVRGTGEPGTKSTTTSSRQVCLQVASLVLNVLEDWPRFEGHFEAQLLEVDDRLSIKCEASGFTLPQISWFLDGQLISESAHQQQQQQLQHRQHLAARSGGRLLNQSKRPFNSLEDPHQQQPEDLSSTAPPPPQLLLGSSFKIGDYVSQDNHVHSFINSSALRPGDGGFYRCQANNGLHSVEFQARIDVRAPANIDRQLPANLSALAGGRQLQLQCPYSGYPVGPVEWLFRPAWDAAEATIGRRSARASGPSAWPLRWAGQMREAAADEDTDQPDPDKDEWLSQAASMTVAPNSEDYPEGLPDYPVPAIGGAGERLRPQHHQMFDSTWDLQQQQRQQLAPTADYELEDDLLASDYGTLALDDDGQDEQISAWPSSSSSSRQKRQTQEDDPNEEQPRRQQWIKLPQSRRHQVSPNGTLTIHEIWRQDAGLYRCKVHPSGDLQSSSSSYHTSGSSSNELQLNVLIPPVISPFSSAELLREGMRNILTCSAIEGDPPISLHWLKDGRPIDDYLQRQVLSGPSSSGAGWPITSSQNHQNHHQQQQQQQPRIRIENNNEYTSTLYFNHVEFRDNGNYTCMATNKAASVNYSTRMVVNVPPKWIKSPKDVDCIAGQNILIDCQAEGHPNPRIWWEIGVDRPNDNKLTSQTASTATTAAGQPPQAPLAAPNSAQSHQLISYQHAPNHYRTIISNSRIHILENASLVIRDVGKQDEAFYLCQAANNFGLLSSLIKLTVNVGASFANKYSVKYVKLNEKVELDCDPSGQSPVQVSWFMRPTVGQSSQSGQLANSTPAALDGTSKSAGGGGESMALSTSTSTQLGRRLFTGQIQTAANAGVDFQQQQAAGQQHHKLIEIDSSISFEVIPTVGGGAGPVKGHSTVPNELVRLHLKQAKRAHSGDFICLAQNQFGGDEKLVRLLVQEPPDPVDEISVVQVEARSISLAWSQPFNGNSPITAYTIEWRPIGASSDLQPTASASQWVHLVVQQAAATLGSLQPLTSYEIRVRAQNQFGHSQVTSGGGGAGGQLASPRRPLVVTTGEEAPAAPPSEIRAVPLSSSSIQVSWTAPANPKQATYSIKGYYLGYKASTSAGATNSGASANASESFIFKTVSLFPTGDANHLQLVDGPYTTTTNSVLPSSGASNRSANAVRVIIGDLKRSTKYSIIVQAFNSAGPGPQSDLIEARTLANDPPPPPQLRVGTTSYTSLELQWSFSSTLFGYAHNYNLLTATGEPLVEKSSLPQVAAAAAAASTGADATAITIDGYHLYYRMASDQQLQQQQQSANPQWHEKKLTEETHTVTGPSQLQPHLPVGATSMVSMRTHHDLTIVEWPANANKTIAGRHNRLNANASSMFSPPVASAAATSFRFVLDQLRCGQPYQVYLVAFNSYGFGLPSEVLRTRTRGGPPMAPRRTDFLTINSTFVQLNLDAWLDAGCAIENFEIKYRQLASRQEAAAMLSSPPSPSGQTGKQQQPQQQQASWLLLSSNISPDEQRSVELRDLQPEMWYAIMASAESSAGRTSQSYAFQTLDKFHQQSAEATELYSSISGAGGGGGLPALFRSSSNPFRSIWFGSSSGAGAGQYNAGQTQNPLILAISPILIGACLCLILFATCSLLLIKRYNSLANSSSAGSSSGSPGVAGDTTSLDSRTGNLRHHSHNHHHHHTNNNNQQHQQRHFNHQHQHFVSKNLENNYGLRPSPPPSTSVSLTGSPADHLNNNNTNQQLLNGATNECYSMKVSPCKTVSTSATNNTTTSGSSTAGSSALLLPANHHHHNKMLVNGPESSICEFASNNYGPPSTLAALNELAPTCNYSQPPAFNKFATLAHRPAAPFIAGQEPGEQQEHHQLLVGQTFKTLQHHHSQGRPLSSTSSFLPNQPLQQQQQARFCNQMSASNYQLAAEQQQQQQQQIYSKLRLLQQFNSAAAAAAANTEFNLGQICQQQQQQQVASQLDACAGGGPQGKPDESLANYNSPVVGVNLNQINEQQLLQQPCQNSNCQQQQQQQQQQQGNNSGGGAQMNDQQDDYALPFPPKWV